MATQSVTFENIIKRDIEKPGQRLPFIDVPEHVCDVTIPVCYQLESVLNADGKVGLTLSGSKCSIVGFMNPVAP